MPGPTPLPPKYVLSKGSTGAVEEGLGATYSTDRFIISGFDVGSMFILSLYINNTADIPRVDSYTGFSVINVKEESNANEKALSINYVGVTTDSTLEVILGTPNVVNHYNIAAYQV